MMKLRAHKTNRWLWLAMSVVVFLAIGLTDQSDVKGVYTPLLFSYATWLVFMFFGWGGVTGLLVTVAIFAAWVVIAAIVGWVLQSVAVIVMDRMRKKTKRSAP